MKTSITILKKELLEIFRDKATFVILLIPILIFPIFNIGMNYLNKESDTKINVCIHYDSQEAYELFNQYVLINETYDIDVIESKEPNKLLNKGYIDCYIIETNNVFDFIYNSSSYDSLSLTTKLGDGFQRYYNSSLSQSYDGIFEMNLKDENGNSANTSNSMSSIFVPIVLVMLIFQNTSSFANDIFAGEKERKTLELLLLSGVKKRSVYCGKSFALIILSIVNLLFSLGSYFISFNSTKSGLQQFKFMQNGNITANIVCIISTMLLLSIIAVFLSLTISMLSKNMKNSQILNELVLAIPVGITALLVLGILKNNTAIFNYIPILNLIISFNNAFIGNIDIINIVLSLITNILLIIVLIILSVKYMNTEKFIS